MVATQPRERTPARTRPALIDCDIHNEPDSEKELYSYLPERWREYLKTYGLREPSGAYYPRFMGQRPDATPPSGRRAGSDVAFMRENYLDPSDVAFGLLLPLFPVGRSLHRELAAALATAVNDWQAAEWLDKEPRLRASIVIPYEFPDLAVAEIERRANDRRFAQALFLGRPHEPMGRPRYWPIYEACERLDLPVCCHAFFSGGNPITGAGWPSFYYEDHVGPPQAMEAHVVSLAVEGVLERFPKLRVVSAEHSFGWLPALLGRLDTAWSLLKGEVPHLRRPPAEYVREHVWVCTQPMDEPPKREHFRQLMHRVEEAGVLDRLVYASDYPHWDWDAPDESIPAWLPSDVRRRIYFENARELYRL